MYPDMIVSWFALHQNERIFNFALIRAPAYP
jgi:hypothetical protein